MTRYANTIIKITTAVMLLMLSACASKPEKPQTGYWQQKAEYYTSSGVQYYQRQQFRQALNEFNKALTTYQRYNAIDDELDSRINLAKTCIALQQLDAASEQIAAAQHIIDAHGLQDKTVYLDIMRVSIAIQQQQLEQANRILALYPADVKLPDEVLVALLINKTRVAILNKQNSAELLDQLKKAAAQQPRLQARILRFEAQLAHDEQRFSDSDAFYTKALNLYRKDADSVGVIATLKEWGVNLESRGELAAATVRYQDMYRTSVSLKQQTHVTAALTALQQLYQQQGDEQGLQWVQKQMDQLNGEVEP